MNSRHLRTVSALMLGLTGLAVAACGPRQTAGNTAPAAPATGAPIDSLPLARSGAGPSASAPTAAQLRASAPIRMASAGAVREPYRYIDDAYDLGETFADSPPDYTVDYDGERPWIWRSQGGDYRVVEQTPDGPRDYYYHAGSDQPFLVRDAQYAFAYDDGALAEVYGSDGRLVSPDVESREAALAAGYLARARRLYSAAVHEQRQAAYAADWQARRDAVLASQRDWRADQQRNDDWRLWRDQHAQDGQARQQQAALDRERGQRQAYAAQATGVVAGAAMRRRQDQAVEPARQPQPQADIRAPADRRPPAAQNQAHNQVPNPVAAPHRDQDAPRVADQAHPARMQPEAAHGPQAGAARGAQTHPQPVQANPAHTAQARAPSAAQSEAHANDARIRAAQAQAHEQQQAATAARIQQARAAPAEKAPPVHPQQPQARVQQAQPEPAHRVQAEAHAPPPAAPHTPPPAAPHAPPPAAPHAAPPKPEPAKPDERPK